MGQFTDVVLGFPTVLFTGGLVAVVAFWTIVLVGGADAHGPWHHGATGGHGGQGGQGGNGGNGGNSGHGVHGGRHDLLPGEGHAHGGGSGALAAAGLGGVPVTVVLSLLVALSWFLTLTGSAALHGPGAPAGPVRVLLHAAVTAAALVGAWFGTWLLVRPLRRLFPDVRPPSREDFVGRVCVIRTGGVTARFGQAEVAAPDGSTAVVQVRQTGEDTFGSGSSALLYAYDPDGEFFWVAPFDSPDTFTTLDTFTT